MGALVGLGVGLGLLLVWSAFHLPRTTRPPRPGGTRAEQLLARAGLGDVSVTSLVLLCVVLADGRVRGDPGGVADGPGGGGLRPDGGVGAGPGAAAAGRPSPAGVRRGLARRRRQPRQRRPRGHVAARRPRRARHQRPRGAAGRVRGVRPRLPGHRPLPRVPRPAQGQARRPCRRPRRRGPEDRPGVGGGELGRLLRNLSGYLRDEARTRSELESRQAWTVNGARLAVSAPWVVLLLMSFQTGSVQAFSSPAGVLVLAVGAALCVVAYRADDAHRPAARREADPGMTLAMWGPSSARWRRAACCWWSSGCWPSVGPSSRSGSRRTSATCPRSAARPRSRSPRPRRPPPRPGSSGRSCARPPTASSGCWAVRRPYAAAWCGRASTSPCTSSASSRCCGGSAASRCARPAAARRSPGAVDPVAALGLACSASRPACCCATTGCPPGRPSASGR